MRPGEGVAAFAPAQVSMAVFLSGARPDELEAELLAGYPRRDAGRGGRPRDVAGRDDRAHDGGRARGGHSLDGRGPHRARARRRGAAGCAGPGPQPPVLAGARHLVPPAESQRLDRRSPEPPAQAVTAVAPTPVSVVGLHGGAWYGAGAEAALRDADLLVGSARQHEDLAPAALPGTPVELWGRIDELAELCDERSTRRHACLRARIRRSRVLRHRARARRAARPRAARSASRAFVGHAGFRAYRTPLGRCGHRDVPRPPDRTSGRRPSSVITRSRCWCRVTPRPRRSVARSSTRAAHRGTCGCAAGSARAGESVTHTDLAGLAAGQYDPLSVVVFVVPGLGVAPTAATGWGRDESEFAHRAGLITKAEVRAVVLGKLDLPPHGVLWDVGAGSGSVGIEAARLVPALRVFAIERDRGGRRAHRRERDRHDARRRQRHRARSVRRPARPRPGLRRRRRARRSRRRARTVAPRRRRGRHVRDARTRGGRGRASGRARADPGEPRRTDRRRSASSACTPRTPCSSRGARRDLRARPRGVDHGCRCASSPIGCRTSTHTAPWHRPCATTGHGSTGSCCSAQPVSRSASSARCSVTRAAIPRWSASTKPADTRSRCAADTPAAPTISPATSPRSIGADAVVTTATDAMNVPALDDLPGFVATRRHRGRRHGRGSTAGHRGSSARSSGLFPFEGGDGPSRVLVTDRAVRTRSGPGRPASAVARRGRRRIDGRVRHGRTSAARRDARPRRDWPAQPSDASQPSTVGPETLPSSRSACPCAPSTLRPWPASTCRTRAPIVDAEVGTPSVAEAAALAAAGDGATLVVTKRKSPTVTVAIARRARPEGSVSVVGLGPGHPRHRTPAAVAAIRRADVVIGYERYVDQCGDLLRPTQHVIRHPIGAEADRCRDALDPRVGGRPRRARVFRRSRRVRDGRTRARARRVVRVAAGRGVARRHGRIRRGRLARRALGARSRLPQPLRSADAVDRHRATAPRHRGDRSRGRVVQPALESPHVAARRGAVDPPRTPARVHAGRRRHRRIPTRRARGRHHARSARLRHRRHAVDRHRRQLVELRDRTDGSSRRGDTSCDPDRAAPDRSRELPHHVRARRLLDVATRTTRGRGPHGPRDRRRELRGVGANRIRSCSGCTGRAAARRTDHRRLGDGRRGRASSRHRVSARRGPHCAGRVRRGARPRWRSPRSVIPTARSGSSATRPPRSPKCSRSTSEATSRPPR